MKTLYFDCFAGASGNMILGALVAAGADPSILLAELRKMDLPHFGIDLDTREKSGIAALHADVRIPDESNHRHLDQIEKIINESALSDGVKMRSRAIFGRLAGAEAKVHGIDVAKVHFHEVGALDAIIDIVGACICFEMLGIERFAASPLHVGSGFVNMAHGKFPVPPPAVAELVKDAPIYSTEIEGELLTPTGAAIITTVCDSFGPLPPMTVKTTAYGAGSRDYRGFPNVLRLIIGETGQIAENARLLLIETNLDDIPAQTLGYVMEKALAAGALDVWFTPIQMKKNRPATMLSVLCGADRRSQITELIYLETTTLGVRVSEVDRECLKRSTRTIVTPFGEIRVKVAEYGGRIVSAKPEYDDVRRAAIDSGLPLRAVEAEVLEQLRRPDYDGI